MEKIVTAYSRQEWSALDVLRLPETLVTAEDKLELVLRRGLIDAPILHEFACRCAERALSRIDNPDTCSVAAIAVKRAWLRGEITNDQLESARDAAYWAAYAIANDAAYLAAYGAAYYDAKYAAYWAADCDAKAANDKGTELAWQVETLIQMLEDDA